MVLGNECGWWLVHGWLSQIGFAPKRVRSNTHSYPINVILD